MTTITHATSVQSSDDADRGLVWRAECAPCDWSAEEAHENPDHAENDATDHVTSTADLTPTQPAEWDVTALAATVVWDVANAETGPWGRGRVSGVLAAWQSLTGEHDRTKAIALAERVANAPAPILALTPPF